ncbi:MAG: HD domain-containing protein [Planctomycetota bacterium]
MSDLKLRQAIAAHAAMLIYTRDESEYFTAKRKAAKRLGVNFKHCPQDLPSNAEIQERLRLLSQTVENYGDSVGGTSEGLAAMRVEALWWMQTLESYQPQLIGSVWTGHVRRGSDIDLHLYTDSLEAVTMRLDEERAEYRVEHKRVIKHHQTRVYRHVHIAAAFPIELTVYSAGEVNYPFLSSITNKPIEKATPEMVRRLIEEEHPEVDLEAELDPERDVAVQDAAFMFKLLLEPLAEVKQSPTYHPEGDALYHSLQVFQLAYNAQPWNEEFLLAALLHDVGKAIDSRDHVTAGLEALDGLVTERTAWLIEHHMHAHAIHDRTVGHRLQRRLAEHPDYDDLLLLGECDRAGRKRGVAVPTVDEALAQIAAAGG